MKKKKTKLILIPIYFIVLVLVNVYVISIAFVFGESMAPTIKGNDIVLLYKFNYTPKVGDIVITNNKNDLQESLVKRVVATKGQTVTIYDGKLLVDGVELEEYSGISADKKIDMIVPEDEIFLIGDNFLYSKDSRDIGTISESDVLGKILFVE